MLRNTRNLMPTVMAGTRNLSAVSLGDYKPVNGSHLNGMKNLSFRSKIPIVKVNTLRSLDPKRNICNIDDFTKNFNEKLERKKSYLDNQTEMRENIEGKFREAGIENLFYEDLDNLLCIAEDITHLEMVINVTQAFMEDDYRLDASQKTGFVTKLIYSCYNLNEIEMAKRLWNQKYLDLYKGKWLNIFYYSWLFENGNYIEIVDDYSKIPDEAKVNLEPLSLVIIAALAKIETKEAFDQMCIIRDKLKYGNQTRSIIFSSWVAYKLRNYGLAYDLLARSNVNSSRQRGFTIINNMKLAILVELGKINEATILLRKILKDANDNPRLRITICHDTMKKYTDAIRKTNEEHLKKDAIHICQELDSEANLEEFSLEEMIFRKVKIAKDGDKNIPHKQENSRDRNEMRKNVRVQEDNPRKKDFKTSGLPYN